MSTSLMDPRAEAFNSDSVLTCTSKSIPSSVQCATLLHNNLVWLSKMVLAQHFCTVCLGLIDISLMPCREECNKYDVTDVSGF
jgi:hypothetical protein